MTRAQIQTIPQDGDFFGMPEIIVEVLSPSNSANDILEREAICLEMPLIGRLRRAWLF